MLYIYVRATKAFILTASALSSLAFGSYAANAHSVNGAHQSLQLNISGQISPKCGLSFPDNEADVVLTERAGTTSLPFAVSCNQRMNVQLRSLNGGLQHTEVGRAPRFNGFANFVPYTLTFSIDSEGARDVSADSREMTSPVQGTVGQIPFESNGSLTLAWATTPPLLGGQYRDVIEIRISGY